MHLLITNKHYPGFAKESTILNSSMINYTILAVNILKREVLLCGNKSLGILTVVNARIGDNKKHQVRPLFSVLEWLITI
jgi:hypothetical protein